MEAGQIICLLHLHAFSPSASTELENMSVEPWMTEKNVAWRDESGFQLVKANGWVQMQHRPCQVMVLSCQQRSGSCELNARKKKTLRRRKEKEVGGIGNVIEELVDFDSQINFKVGSDDIQILLDSHDQELAIDELIEMHKQKQDFEKV
ncbi:hypothetical protein TNCV_693811 [Trichonephila clavipes]|nr:hypothetical protein TNCV_693811 [Trichonephila clavipes]